MLNRGLIEASESVILTRDRDLAARLTKILDAPPVSKPSLHTGGAHNDYFHIKIDLDVAKKIVELLIDAEADAVGNNGETTPEASRISALVNVWTEYIEYRRGRDESGL